jgi:hypothetical protein
MTFKRSSPSPEVPGLSGNGSLERLGTGLTLVIVLALISLGLRISIQGSASSVLHPARAWCTALGVLIVLALISWLMHPIWVLVYLGSVLGLGVWLLLPLRSVYGSWIYLVGGLACLFFIAKYFSLRFLRIVAVVLTFFFLLTLSATGREVLNAEPLNEARVAGTKADKRLMDNYEARNLDDERALSGRLKIARTSKKELGDALGKAEPLPGNPVDPVVEIAKRMFARLPVFLVRGPSKEEMDRVRSDIVLLQKLPSPQTIAITDVVEAAQKVAGDLEAVRAAEGRVRSDGITLQERKARMAVEALCEGGGGSWKSPGRRTPRNQVGAVESCVADTGGASPQELALLNANVELALAGLKPNSKDALKSAQDAVAEAQGVAKEPPPGVDMSVSIVKGANRMVSGAPFLSDPNSPTLLGTGAWVLLLGAALIYFNYLQRRSARRGVGPVLTEEISAPEGVETKLLTAQMRQHLLKNVPEPGAVPGAQATVDLTNLVEGAAPAPWKFLSPVLALVKSVLALNSGFTVSTVYRGPEEPKKEDDGEGEAAPPEEAEEKLHRFHVTICDGASKAARASSMKVDEDIEQALRAASFWAAGWIVSRSRTIPSWAKFDETTSDALALHDVAEELEITKLIEAAKQAPDSALLLTTLGNRFALQEKHFEAFKAYLRAATLCPLFLVARYRLGVAFSLLASDLDAHWWKAAPVERAALVDQLERLNSLTGNEGFNPELNLLLSPGPLDAEVSNLLCRMAIQHFRRIQQILSRSNLWWLALQQSERAYWLGALGFVKGKSFQWGRRKELTSQARSAMPAVGARGRLRRDEQLSAEMTWTKSEAEKKGSPYWHLLYNYACFQAVGFPEEGLEAEQELPGRPDYVPNPPVALKYLERAIAAPGHCLTADWLAADPDLEMIKDEPRFKLLMKSVKEK